MFNFFNKKSNTLKKFINKPFIKSRYESIYYLMLDIKSITDLSMYDQLPKLKYNKNLKNIETSLWFVDSNKYTIQNIDMLEKDLAKKYKKLKKYKKFYENNLNFKYSIYNQQIINILLSELKTIFDE